MTIRKEYMLLLFTGMIILLFGITGCSKQQSATLNNRMKVQDATTTNATNDTADSTKDTSESESPMNETSDALEKAGYDCDIEKDKDNFNGHVDIVVGNNLYTTQINDWYTNFDQYQGKIVEIEGYYIDDYAPYTFIGRYGPSCPYCNGGYVSFEFYTLDDLSELKSAKDWINVKGILRQGEDTSGIFYYIEVLSLVKMDKVGMDTVTN